MEKHDLLHEFPEYQEKIHELKMENNHFKKLFDDYDELAHEIYRINTDVEPVSDEYSHTLKTKMLHLKDEIFSILAKN
ncbi:YdcH family protein [Flavobacterium sp.]|uniref:YdcH family protein n=1 Tax=Flavobacterium sp. TaxID=239 RepID=UPI002CA542F0|nr:YdcH family protein [Flavobacterium sp.]HQA75442.1 YdcH family protein [Flavobacterium sp.]